MKEFYEFKDAVKNIYKGIEAQKVGEEIRALGGMEGNPVKPDLILQFARENEESELYKCFDWDDTVAAEKYRLEQARRVTRAIVIIKVNDKPVEQPKTEIRAFFEEKRGGGYRPTTFILKNKDSYERLLENALAELRAFKRKYHMLTELNEIFALID